VAAKADVLNLSWMGRAEGGLRGLRRPQTPSIFTRTYDYVGSGEELQGIPVQVWSVKTLTAQWQSPMGKQPLRHALEVLPNGLKGSVASDLAWTLQGCQLSFRGQGWDLGTLAPW